MSDTLTTTFPAGLLYLNQFMVYILVALVTWAAFNDVKEYKIPNVIVLAIMVLYIPFILTAPMHINFLDGLTTFAIVLVAGFALFAVGIIGAGDIKLFAAVALWTGSASLMTMFTTVAFTGGGLAIVYLAQLYLQKFTGLKDKDYKPTMLVLPYGVAIAGGAYYTAYNYLQPIWGTTGA